MANDRVAITFELIDTPGGWTYYVLQNGESIGRIEQYEGGFAYFAGMHAASAPQFTSMDLGALRARIAEREQ